MKKFLDIKNLSLIKPTVKHTLISIAIFLFMIAGGFTVLNYMQDRVINENLTKTTETVESIWNTATLSHQEAIEAYLNHYILDDKVLELLEMANSQQHRQQARLHLYRYLYGKYQDLRNRLLVRQLNFILPDNTVFLRMHAPHRYADDLTTVRSSIVYVNREKRPFTGIEIGKIMVGYRYIFPVFSREGVYLGCVEFGRSFETIRRTLNQIDTESDYLMLIKKSEVDQKVLEEYRGWYKPFGKLQDWVVESTEGKMLDSPKPVKPEFLEVLLNTDIKSVLNSPGNLTVYTKHRGRYYKITAVKFSNPYQEDVATVLMGVSRAHDIGSVVDTVLRFKLMYTALSALICVGIFLYVKRNYYIQFRNRELEIITSNMGSGLIILDIEGRIRYINQFALEVLRFSSDDVLGAFLHDVVHHHTGTKETCPVYLAVRDGREFTGDDTFLTKDGRFVDVHLKLRPLVIDENYLGSILVFDDITQRKQLEKRLFQLATEDPLTGLYNRRYSTETMRKFKNQSDRYGYPLSVMMLDIDNFKKINDTFGHDTGDEVLRTLAKIIRENIRASDIPSRWGGEEFLVVLPNTDLEGATNLAERIREAVSRVQVGPVSRFTVSIGVAQYEFGETLDDLLIKADRGLYEAKRSGKNRVVAVVG